MPTNRAGRTPARVYGHGEATTTESVRVWVSSRERVSLAVWQLWERAARTNYSPGEPLELTQARDELELARDVARDLHRLGTPAVLSAHVVNALRVAGWAL